MRTIQSAIRPLAGLMCAALLLAACGSDGDEAEAVATNAGSQETSANESPDDAESEGEAAALDPDAPPVRLALISILTPGIDLLENWEAGAFAAAEQINSQGGFGGREVIIDVCNSELDTSVATGCAYETLDKEPVAMFGCEPQWAATGLEIYAEAGVPSVNCPNSEVDFTHEMSFAIDPGGFGQYRAAANWLCARDDIDKAVSFAHDFPQQRQAVPAAVAPALEACGIEYEEFYYPAEAEDLTPHINNVLDAEPDFVMTTVGGPQVIQLLGGFADAGFPTSNIIAPSNAISGAQIDAAPDVLEGVNTTYPTASWSNTDDPEVAEYLAAMEGSEKDPREAIVQQGYAFVKFFHMAAESIGFDEFDATTLTEFLNTADGISIFMSNEYVNEGPEGFPQVKQPAVRIMQVQDGELVAQEIPGAEGDDWVPALAVSDGP